MPTSQRKRQRTEAADAKQVEIFTDGAYQGNPGPGGWDVVLRYQGREKEISGDEVHTTNNRMEPSTVVEATSLLKEPCDITLWSDLKYVCNAIGKGWAKVWRKNSWKKADKKPALNSDLWERLLDLLEQHHVTIRWVKGHAGHPENERCDRLAVAAAEQFKSKP